MNLLREVQRNLEAEAVIGISWRDEKGKPCGQFMLLAKDALDEQTIAFAGQILFKSMVDSKRDEAANG